MINSFWKRKIQFTQNKIIHDIAFVFMILCIAIGAWLLRTTGLEWDQNHHLHPDERFLTMVETSLQPTQNLSEYFDTTNSTLNPQNRGYTFFVYGTFPIFLIRYLGQWFNQMGYDQVNVLGRLVSATFDVGTVLLVFLIAFQVYKKTILASLAAAFYAVSVLPIQLSHFFVVETITNFFGFLTFLFAVQIFTKSLSSDFIASISCKKQEKGKYFERFVKWFNLTKPYLLLYGLFGFSIGLAAASKINAIALFLLLPIAMIPTFLSDKKYGMERLLNFLIPAGLIACIVAVVTFRFFQPYAFMGPGFFNLKLNPNWVANLKELSNLSSPVSNFPPNVQWADRPIWFSLQNLVGWGMGLPLGCLAILSLFWMIKRTIKGEWRAHLPLIVWTLFYFIWQSLLYNRTMRYQMLVYPTFAVIAAWGVVSVFEKGKILKEKAKKGKSIIYKAIAIIVGISVLGLTTAWAISFVQIYKKPITRIEASSWIYQNVPGPINLEISNDVEVENQPLSYPLGMAVQSFQPISQVYTAPMDGSIQSLKFSHMVDLNPILVDSSISIPVKKFLVTIIDLNLESSIPFYAQIQDSFIAQSDPRGDEHVATFNSPLPMIKGHQYQLTYSVEGDVQSIKIFGPNTLGILSEGIPFQLPVLEPVEILNFGDKYTTTFSPIKDGILKTIYTPHIVDWGNSSVEKRMNATITIDDGDITHFLGDESISSSFQAENDIRGSGYSFSFEPPITLKADTQYTLTLQNTAGDGKLAIYGSRQVNESSWDDPLPYSLYGINVFDFFNGVYRTDLNLEMYWEDSNEKAIRIASNLDQADYLFISSNRQWGSIARLPDQYPMSSEFYRELIGCPAEHEIAWCYRVAEPGMFKAGLGYQLIKVFQSEPTLGSLTINTQFAEEAFTVYDHPKVLIFQKTPDFNIQAVQTVLTKTGSQDSASISKSNIKNGLMLDADQLQEQQVGGTWSELFSRNSILNQFPGIGLIFWYFFISLLGWVVYPMVRIGLGGLKDKGYPFIKLIGMLLFAFLSWIAGSLDIPVTRSTLIWIFIGLFIINCLLFLIYRKFILSEIKTNWKHFLFIELLGILFFIFFLLVRLGNPDLWHPWKGGEKPMDFSYLNAVIKSTIFPPYDPWFAGGYINYYYFGFVLAGMPVKLLGIIPSIAYNLILPTFFSFVGLGAFCIGWNLVYRWLEDKKQTLKKNIGERFSITRIAVIGGLIASVFVLILGNLGSLRMIWRGFQYLATGGQTIDGANAFQHWAWAFKGFFKFLGGSNLMYGPGDYYWIPSRAFPGEAITEFPFFTFLYGDPHAHLFALPLSILAIAWSLAILFRKWVWNEQGEKRWWLNFLIAFFLGGLAIGALRPTNTWDIFTYLPLGMVAVIYTSIKYSNPNKDSSQLIPVAWKKIVVTLGSTILLIVVAFLLYQPFSYWYAQGYNEIAVWEGDHTPFWSYITHWGLFLFICFSWIAWEFRDWLASTPASFLNRMKPFQVLIYMGCILCLAGIIGLLIFGIEIAWLVIPMMLFSLALTLRPKYPEMKRVISFLVTLGLTLTFLVEMVYLRGDVGRMNTVFKIYLQAWTILAFASAGAVLVLWPSITKIWSASFRRFWMTILILLITSASLFTLLGPLDKIRDRMNSGAPHTLDGMAYMPYSTYSDNGKLYSLEQDYNAILWMQDNIEGSPVILEGYETEYRWGNRYTIYTGLPGVIGWNYHQRQQRGIISDEDVWARVNAVGEFYSTSDMAYVIQFLNEYHVKYIIVGLLEKAVYPQTGLEKFEEWDGGLWHQVYLDQDTVIYQVGF